MFSRKIVSASLSSTLFAIVLSLIMATFYRESWIVGQNYFISTAAILNIFLLYLFPAVLIYGVIASIISDTIAEFLAKKRHNQYMVLIISGILHILFGLVQTK
ncbi:hypothetical protein [Bacillus sp. MUM 13]|uniref:hypothetical protein n=1 Tax=Bacillus sp. MUM 13 TaxID=1678001 RepID=UPI0008F5C27F|nr:hypothetical protein [Bacillus sp. MUM 13]OIK09581.1 hypothetical protein BIV59_16580 [Bacillus sp. MUM 13]